MRNVHMFAFMALPDSNLRVQDAWAAIITDDSMGLHEEYERLTGANMGIAHYVHAL